MKRLVFALDIALIGLVAPPIYIEVACRGEPSGTGYQPLIVDPNWQRAESRTLLTYPEWHIVHAYDEYARVITTGAPHEFGYLRAISGFWGTLCPLTEAAASMGGVTGDTKATIYTIGVSFTAELLAKAAYEETLGRVTVWLRGAERAPLDDLSAAQAAAYGAFLGFAFRLTIFVLQVLGNIASQALSISQPLGQGITMEPNTTISTMLMMVGVTLLMTADFHVEAFGILYKSYEVFPLGSTPDFDRMAYMLTQKAMGIFEISVTLAFPFILLNFVYNLLLGFVNRAMPQLLVSFVGMPAITGVGMVLLAIAAGTLLIAWMKYFVVYSNQLIG